MTVNPELKAKMMKYRWAIFIVLAVAYFFVYFHRVSTTAMAPDIEEAFGIGAAATGLLASAYFYAYTAMQLPSGIFTDKWGPKRSATVFIIITAIGSLVCGLSTSYEMLIAGRVIIGVGVAVIYIPIMRVLALWFRKDEFASLSGILLMVGNVGTIAAATPLVLMTEALGWQNVFIILAVITFIIGLMCWVIVKDHPKDKGFPSIEEIESEETGKPIEESTSEKIPMVQSLKLTFGSGRKFWTLAIWFFFMYGSIMVYQGLQAGAYYTNVYDWDKGTWGILLTLVGVGMIIGCPLAGFISDKILHSRKKVLVLGTLVYTIIWAVIWLMSGKLDSLVAQGIINFCFGFFGGFFVVSYAQVKELYPVSIVGVSTAALNLFPFLGGAILQSISGYIVADKTPEQFQTLWMIMFICMVVATICAFLSMEKQKT